MGLTFEYAAAVQYRRQTLYTVILVGTSGQREQLGITDQHSGRGLEQIAGTLFAQRVIARCIDDASSVRYRKTARALILSNGWTVEFGDTLRQTAAAEKR